MGCDRFIWNAKCDEQKYLLAYARRYLPIGTFPPVDQKFSQYKSKELSPWLYDCPSQILRNSASRWYNTQRAFMKGQCGAPRRKRKSNKASVLLTRELFRFEKCADGVTRLFIGTKTNNIGYLSLKIHRSFAIPNSITISRENERYLVSLCYDDGVDEADLKTAEQHLEYLSQCSREELERFTIGIDRGVARPVQAGEDVYDLTEEQKKKKKAKERYIRRCQRRLSKQQKSSKRRRKMRHRLAKASTKIANIRKDFCHKTSHSIVNREATKVIILEDLNTSGMTKKPAPKKDCQSRRFLPNRRKAKSGLNRSILDKCWYQLEIYLRYKAHRAGKAVFAVPAHHTSQECADCGHTHPNNRKRQDLFSCQCCGHADHADHNAAEVIKKRAINSFLHSGTELSRRGVLLGIGRGAIHKTPAVKAACARGSEASKEKALATAVA